MASARQLLEEAWAILGIRLPGQASRAAYTAALQAGRALIYERTDRVAKTDKQVHEAFYRLSADDPGIAQDLRTFLPRTLRLKSAVDYGVGPGRNVTSAEARAAVDTAVRFVSVISNILDAPAPA
jgi:uncharacterized protein (UPF0332 family)